MPSDGFAQPVDEPIADLQAFVDEKWAVAQPEFYPHAAEGPCIPRNVTPSEAAYFLSSVTAGDGDPPLFSVGDDRRLRSDRYPPRRDGRPRVFHFFESPGRLRLETIVHMAAMARLRDEFGWPREHLIFESPDFVVDGRLVLRREALDILLLEEPCELTATTSVAAARTLVGVEVKADSAHLDKLLNEMRACQRSNALAHHTNHPKCRAIDALRPRLFLGVAAQTWRLFTVVECDGRAILGDELPNLAGLHFRGA